MFKNYDPARVVVTFRGIPIRGYAEGTFVSVERDEDSFEKAVGSQGDVTRVRKRNRAGSATLTLQQASPTNDELSAIMLLDEASGTGYGPLLVKDLNGTTLASAAVAWLVRPATTSFADGAESREWKIDCAELTMTVGGALV
jgi:hypothetical protein